MSGAYLYNVLSHAQNHHAFRNTFQGILKQSAYAVAGAGAGGLAGGPLAALVGTIVGAIYGYKNSENYDSLLSVAQGISSDEKEMLTNEIKRVVGSTTFSDFVEWFKHIDHQKIFMDLVFEIARNSMYSR